jgi:hypothetical protein
MIHRMTGGRRNSVRGRGCPGNNKKITSLLLSQPVHPAWVDHVTQYDRDTYPQIPVCVVGESIGSGPEVRQVR